MVCCWDSRSCERHTHFLLLGCFSREEKYCIAPCNTTGAYLLFIPRGRLVSGQGGEVSAQHSLHVVQYGALLHLHTGVGLSVIHHQLALLTGVLAHEGQQQGHLCHLLVIGSPRFSDASVTEKLQQL